MPCNFMMIFYGPKGRSWALVAPGGVPRRRQPTRAPQEAQAWVPPGPPLCSINTPNIPKTLAESTKINSSRCKFQKH